MKSARHRAGWIALNPQTWVEDGVVEVIDGRIASVEKARTGREYVDHGPGVIMPALVNAHTHLSLSALSSRVSCSRGFVEWVRDVIRVRECSSLEEMASAAAQAAKDAKASGTGALAEVGPLEPGTIALAGADLEGIVFNEFLGNGPFVGALPDDRPDVWYSYAGHALHSTSPGILTAMKSACTARNSVFSIHLAESEAETEFLTTGRGEWATLLESRGIDFSNWDLRGERPVPRAERLGLMGPETLAVHLLDVTQTEIDILAENSTKVCVCPRSNLALHGRLPDIEAIVSADLTVALGTDSLLSSSSLDMFDEMAFVASNYPGLRPETILRMATMDGATALGMDVLGAINPGNRARLVYIALEADSAQDAASKLVSKEFEGVRWI